MTTTSAATHPTATPKRVPSDLAVCGGVPAFAEPLHVGRPNVGDRTRLLQRMNDLLDRRWFTNDGPYVMEFEQAIARWAGVRHCIAMCNATIALEIAIRALDLRGEVIVPSFTFVASAHALQWQEITPVFCDIGRSTRTIDPARVEELITPRTTGILGVHLWGRCCDVDALSDIAQRRNLKLLFDAAHAFGCSWRGRRIGALGNAEVFSFHATKFLNSFEGGAVVTNDDRLAERVRLMKNFGFAKSDEVVFIGTNGKMTEASGAMGLTSLESMDAFIDVNRAHYRQYRQLLSELDGISLIEYDEAELSNYQYVVLEVDTDAPLNRDELMQVLHAENVLARRYFYPGVHRMEPYRSYQPGAWRHLPETERLAGRVLSLPTGTAITSSDIARIAEICRTALGNATAVRAALSRAGAPQRT